MVLTLQNECILYLSNIVEVSILNVQMMHVCVLFQVYFNIILCSMNYMLLKEKGNIPRLSFGDKFARKIMRKCCDST